MRLIRYQPRPRVPPIFSAPAERQQANGVITPAQRWIAAACLFGVGVAMASSLLKTLSALLLAVTVIYLVAAAAKLWISILGARFQAPAPSNATKLDEATLPSYTVLVPLYNESHGIPGLVRAMSALDYPRDRLEVLILLEEDDALSQDALTDFDLPPFIRGVTVSDTAPRGKPRACNAGLAQACGDLIVIYDAEDIPEPDQLRKAAACFLHGDDRLACVQGKLDFYNADENLLTRWFAIEYATWFTLYLPGLQAARLPIPLGGTSNHLRTSVLRSVGGWDSYNVTEDADLGLVLARAGYTTNMIDSTTWEEANSQIGNWIRQRSRWMKGYMVTWLVHMRHPANLIAEVGWRGFLGVQCTLAFSVIGALLNPLFWLLAAAWLLTRPEIIHTLFAGPAFYIGATSLYAGNWLLLITAALACHIRGHHRLSRYVFSLPLLWILMSVAAWKGVVQLVRRPTYWEKTAHGISRWTYPPSVGIGFGGDDVDLPTAAAEIPGSSSRISAAGGGETQFLRRGDALARTYSAVQVLHGYEPKLANLRLVWPVLPTILQLPLAAIAPGLAAQGGTGPIVSGVAAAWCAVALNRILSPYLTARLLRYACLSVFFLNPLLLELAISGLTEMLLVGFVLLAWWGIEQVVRRPEDTLPGILMVAIGTSGAFLCRYEGVVAGAAMIGCLLLVLTAQSKTLTGFRQSIPALESALVLVAGCFGYVLALFFFFNYSIMGNVLYFAKGTGSMDEWRANWLQSKQTVSGLVGHPIAAAWYAVDATWFVFAGALLIIPVAIVLIARRFDLRLLFLLGLTLIAPVQQAFATTMGQSPGWARYYVLAAFLGLILIVAVFRTILDRVRWTTLRPAITVAMVALIVLGTAIGWATQASVQILAVGLSRKSSVVARTHHSITVMRTVGASEGFWPQRFCLMIPMPSSLPTIVRRPRSSSLASIQPILSCPIVASSTQSLMVRWDGSSIFWCRLQRLRRI